MTKDEPEWLLDPEMPTFTTTHVGEEGKAPSWNLARISAPEYTTLGGEGFPLVRKQAPL